MSVWIKICGFREPETLKCAIESGVDAVGFVFAESIRQISPQEASVLAQDIPSHIARVAVFLYPVQRELDMVLDRLDIDYIQADRSALLTLEVPTPIRRIPVIRENADLDLAYLPSFCLYEGARSGQGEIVDWSNARRVAGRTKMILAGGLDPTNVADAIEHAQPFGVDVSSGVESARGIKDKKLIRQFITHARTCNVLH